VVRYDPDGSVDNSFGIAGSLIQVVTGHESTNAVSLQADGKIVTAGSTVLDAGSHSERTQFLLSRYTVNGDLDEHFGNSKDQVMAPVEDAVATGVAIQPDGKIVATGSSAAGAGLARYNTDGSLDPFFGDGGIALTTDDEPQAMALQTDGKIVTVGGSQELQRFRVTRYLGEASPTVQAGGPYASADGGPVTITGAVSDPDSPTVTHSWSVAPQSDVDAGAACMIADPAALSTTVSCTDDGAYTITFTAGDGVNPPTTQTAQFTVAQCHTRRHHHRPRRTDSTRHTGHGHRAIHRP